MTYLWYIVSLSLSYVRIAKHEKTLFCKFLSGLLNLNLRNTKSTSYSLIRSSIIFTDILFRLVQEQTCVARVWVGSSAVRGKGTRSDFESCYEHNEYEPVHSDHSSLGLLSISISIIENSFSECINNQLSSIIFFIDN